MKKILSTLSQKWSEYLLEVLVITIGILGAFGLNSWNGNKQKKENIHKVLDFIKEDLSADIIEIDSAMKGYQMILEHLDQIIDGEVTEGMFAENIFYFICVTGFEDIMMDKRGVNLLEQVIELDNDEEIKLANNIIYFYTDHTYEIDVSTRELSDAFTFNIDSWKNSDWFFSALYHEDLSEFAKYASESTDFRNKVGFYKLIFSIYVDELENFKENGQSIIADIDSYFGTTQ